MLDSLLTEEPNSGHYSKYRETQEKYHTFAREFIERAEVL